MKIRTGFPHNVRVIEHEWIVLPDGARLAARRWMPETDVPVPVLLEYVPYRLHDGTHLHDPMRHAWFAGHGYASVRVDLRGSGNSDGVLDDEYAPVELADGVAIVESLAAQPWCSGAVGMFGISWGGFNALQVAALAPPALRAVVTVASTDDRYADDVHYMGGSVLAFDALPWASTLQAFMARPPNRAVFGAGWRDAWRRRIEATPHFAARWLAHQQRDDYWRSGSVCEDYAAIRAPVLAVGGWADGYTNAVPRLLAGLSCPRKAIIGPWAHNWPYAARPGPQIGFLQVCLRWWDRWLSDVPTGVEDDPDLTVYVQDSVAPARSYRERPGRWRAVARWPAVPPVTVRDVPDLEAPFDLRHGAEAGVWCPFGGRGELAGDQRAEDARSACFDLPADDVREVLGVPELSVTVAADCGQLVVRLCDVAPGGASLLVSRGSVRVERPGAVVVRLDACAHRLAAGHHWRLAVAASYWPMLWPSAVMAPIALCNVTLQLPLIASTAAALFDAPEAAAALTEQAAGGGYAAFDVVDERMTGRQHIERGSGDDNNRSLDRYTMSVDDPLSASVRCERTQVCEGTRVELNATMNGSADKFVVHTELVVHDGAAEFARRQWSDTLPRI